MDIDNWHLKGIGILYKFLSFAIVLVGMQFVSPASALNCNIKPGDARLSTFCLISNLPPNLSLTQEQAVGLSTRMYNVGQPPLLPPDSPLLENGYGRYSGSFYPFPVLDYIKNLNGGNPQEDRFSAIFVQEDERFHAKSGIVVGAGAGYGGKLIVRQGNYLDFSTSGRYSYNQEHKLPLINSRGNVCSVNHIFNWWYLDPCANISYSKKRLTKNASSILSLNLSKFFTSNPQTYHHAKLGYNYFIVDDLEEVRNQSDYQQGQFQFNFDTVYSTDIYTSFGITLGRSVKKDQNQFDKKFDRLSTTPILKRNFSATVGTLFFESPISLSLGFNDTDVVSVLGNLRYDRTTSVYLSYRPFSSVNLGIGYRKTDSSYSGTNYYDSNEMLYDISYTPFFF